MIMSSRSPDPMRSLSVDDLGLRKYLNGSIEESLVESYSGPILNQSDRILVDIRQAFQDGFAGVIFVGPPPGTSKSWYASRVALALTEGDSARVRSVQFHPSFQFRSWSKILLYRDGPKHGHTKTLLKATSPSILENLYSQAKASALGLRASGRRAEKHTRSCN